MKKFYFTFGQAHSNIINGTSFDGNCVVLIQAKDYNQASAKMYEWFGRDWCMGYEEEPDMQLYPSGIIEIHLNDEAKTNAHRKYLGDAVFTEVENGMIKLTTKRARNVTDTIYLEPYVYKALREWADKNFPTS